MGLKKSFRRLINRSLGLDIVPYRPGPSDLSYWITRTDVDLVLDVGANTGQFASHLFGMGYKGQIVSFEPMSAAHDQLTAASRSNPRWIIASRMAIGDSAGEIDIHVSANSLSSSALKSTAKLIDSSPESRVVSSEKAPLHRLSDAARPYLQGARSPFLKIDVQGFENRVLAGAADILPRMVGLELELSFAPLYEGEWPIEDMLRETKRLGFYLHTLRPFFEDEKGRSLQAEAIFFRNGYTPRK